ncbi:hypothetical protein [Salinicola halimionae]|nr:hypothetical protein [Salinicola halimionae]
MNDIRSEDMAAEDDIAFVDGTAAFSPRRVGNAAQQSPRVRR